jgi:UDP-N-acetylmuramoyl-L-alanyl-D-glutamate--2,6-diaminopimelate ligase
VTFSGLNATTKPAFEAGQRLRDLLPPNSQLTCDSRKIGKSDSNVFLAYAGDVTDGRKFIDQAFSSGAQAVVYDPDGFSREGVSLGAVNNEFPVTGLKTNAGVFAAGFYANPSAKMTVIAITGTNGKTSCSQWVAQGLAANHHPAAVIGTLGAGLLNNNGNNGNNGTIGTIGTNSLDEFGLTTPDAVLLQRLLASFESQSAKYVALEASSIGIVQSRLAGTNIAIAVFTNLSRDHLDFHGDMNSYELAKAALFAWPSLRYAIVNLNDVASERMVSKIAPNDIAVTTVGYGITHDHQSAIADFKVQRTLLASNISFNDEGLSFSLASSWGDASVQLKLHGLFNLSNALAVLATWLCTDMPFALAIDKLEKLDAVPGRMQRVDVLRHHSDETPKHLPLVFVDYAHTPDALDKTLAALVAITKRRGGKLWCVFGAGGDRDKGKRPLMAKVAEQLADLIVLTSDNPRSEDPATILKDVAAGFTGHANVQVMLEADRKTAIEMALTRADATDVVLVAGKGHENYQEVLGVKRPFSDISIASDLLTKRLAEFTAKKRVLQ